MRGNYVYKLPQIIKYIHVPDSHQNIKLMEKANINSLFEDKYNQKMKYYQLKVNNDFLMIRLAINGLASSESRLNYERGAKGKAWRMLL